MKRLLQFIRVNVLVSNILSTLMLWAVCASCWLHPEDFPRLSLLGLLFPVFLLVHLLFIPAWLVVNYRRAWIPLAGLLPVMGFILDYCPLNLPQDIPPHAVKVLTWNSHHYGSLWEDKEEGKRMTVKYLLESDADIICMQETTTPGAVIDSFYTEMEQRGYHRDTYLGTVLLTRFDILDMDTIAYESLRNPDGSKGNGSKWYRLLIEDKEVILVNNHLESNRLEDSIKQDYVANLDNPEYRKMKESGRKIGRKLTTSTVFRGAQTDTLCRFAEQHRDERVILCGDFNDTPVSYTCQQLGKRLKNAFSESGRGIGLSYNKRGFWVRIDHIFHNEQCRSYQTYIDRSIATSDHYPLISWLVFE